MGRIAFRLALGGLALYFYSQGNTLWTVLCILAVVWSFLAQDLGRLFGLVGRLTDVPQEHAANCVLTYTISLNHVFEHPAVNDLFAKLHKWQKAPAETLDEWRKLLAKSYARKYKRDDLVYEVRFHIKSNVLFVNGEPSLRDYVYDQVEIPYRWTEAGAPQEAPFGAPNIESELSVRTLLLNGMLVLQVGYFDKEYSPHILHGYGLPAYETYATLTSFPLMYSSYRHGVPVRYLNLVAQATPSYRAAERGSGFTKDSDRYRDWKTLHQEITAYRRLCDWDTGRGDTSREIETWNKLRRGFEEKYKKLLADEEYKSLGSDDDDWGDFPDFGYTYWNRYGKVFFQNMNANRDTEHEKHWLAGYHEERP